VSMRPSSTNTVMPFSTRSVMSIGFASWSNA
jgi:hypothetical protein